MVEFELEEAIDKSVDSVNSAKLFQNGNDLTNQIIDETDPDRLNELTQLFTINQKKKEIARINKLTALQEIIDDEVMNRISCTPEDFDNDQLEKYMISTQKVLNSINGNQTEMPQILVNNQTNFNINPSGLNRESRERVYDAVKSILSSLQEDNKDDIIDIKPNEENSL